MPWFDHPSDALDNIVKTLGGIYASDTMSYAKSNWERATTGKQEKAASLYSLDYLNVNNIIVEAQKRKIKTIGDLKNIVNSALRSADKTILIAIYNNQSQRSYIGVKLD